jgi:hypothetical protein
MRPSAFVAIQAKGNSVATPFGLRSGLRQMVSHSSRAAMNGPPAVSVRCDPDEKAIQSLRPSGFAPAFGRVVSRSSRAAMNGAPGEICVVSGSELA